LILKTTLLVLLYITDMKVAWKMKQPGAYMHVHSWHLIKGRTARGVYQ